MTALYEYMECRDLRHAWARDDDEFIAEKGRVREFSRVLVCMRCGTTRRDDFRVIHQHRTHLIHRVGARYRYAPGYQIKGGVKIEEMRWSLFNKVLTLVKR